MHLVPLAAIGFQVAVGIEPPGVLPGEVERGQDDAAKHRGGEVGEHRDDGDRHDHQHVAAWHPVQHP